MIQQRLQHWIDHPEQLDEESLYELRTLLARYPYFQTARILYLKNLFLLHDPKFEEELWKGALYVADLSLLFYFIEGERFVIKQHPKIAETEDTHSADRTLDLINRFLSELPESVTNEFSFPANTSTDYVAALLDEQSEHSDAGEVPVTPLRGQDLIDSFIEKSSERTVYDAKETEENRPADVKSAYEEKDVYTEESEDENYFTETLAKIYVKQRRYDKALEIIKKLNLKYPKKNTYFADQIRFLEKLIINAKSK